MNFELVGQVRIIETIAVGPAIRVLRYLRRSYGRGRWRKMIGRRDVRIKRYLDE